MRKNMKIVSVLFVIVTAIASMTVVFAHDETVTPFQAPEIVSLKDINNELFTVVEEVEKFSIGQIMPSFQNTRTKWTFTPVDQYSSKGDKTVDVLGNPVTVEHDYYDGYTAKDIFNMRFESSPETEKYYLTYFGKTDANSPLVWGVNTYYNFGYVQLFIDRDEAYVACYNPFTNVFYRYPGYMSSINDDGTAILDDGEKIYKVQFKPVVVSVMYDGKRIGFDQLPVIENGRTLVPLRAIFEKIGASVEWDGETQTVTATKDDTTVSLTINSTTAKKNGQEIVLDVPAKIINGRTMVPVRFVSDCFGVGVEWKGDIQTVVLTSK